MIQIQQLFFEQYSIVTMPTGVHYKREQLQSLLEMTSQEVYSQLLGQRPYDDHSFFENFTTISLRAIKYLTALLNHHNSDQILGDTVDRMARGFHEALKEYRGRNVFVHSIYERYSEGGSGKDDEIYHFLNTRNNLLPVECLSTYENDKQRRELQQFVEQMKKHSSSKNQQKRSLMLPKDNNFALEIGRKCTLDPYRLIDSNHHQQQTTEIQPQFTLASPNTENVENQTESHIVQPETQIELQQQKKGQNQAASQMVSVQVSEAVINSLSNKHLIIPARKEKKKGLAESDNKSKKKAKFATSNQLTKSIEIGYTSKSIGKRKLYLKQPSQCSLKIVKTNEKLLSICSHQVDIVLKNHNEITNTINYTASDTHILPEAPVQSNAINLDLNLNSNHSHGANENINAIISSSQQNNEISQKLRNNLLNISQQENKNNQASVWSSGDIGEDNNKKQNKGKLNNKNVKQFQKLSISTLKIADSSENLNQSSSKNLRMKKTDSILFADSSNKQILKRKKHNGQRHLFHSFILSQADSVNNCSQNARISKISFQAFDNLLKIQQNDQNANIPSFTIKQSGSLPSSFSQDNLGSIQKPDQQKLIKLKCKQDSDTSKFNKKKCNLSNDTNPKQTGSNMIRIANFHKLSTQLSKKMKNQHSSFSENQKLPNSHRNTTQISPIRMPLGRLKVKEEDHLHSATKSLPYNKAQSDSAHSSSKEVDMLKRKLRNRGYKDKLGHYLQLIQATHHQFCGANCEHLKQLFEGSQGNIAAQIIRLFRKLK